MWLVWYQKFVFRFAFFGS